MLTISLFRPWMLLVLSLNCCCLRQISSMAENELLWCWICIVPTDLHEESPDLLVGLIFSLFYAESLDSHHIRASSSVFPRFPCSVHFQSSEVGSHCMVGHWMHISRRQHFCFFHCCSVLREILPWLDLIIIEHRRNPREIGAEVYRSVWNEDVIQPWCEWFAALTCHKLIHPAWKSWNICKSTSVVLLYLPGWMQIPSLSELTWNFFEEF